MNGQTPLQTCVGYIRTVSDPNGTSDDAFALIRDYARQQKPEVLGVHPQHRFQLGASTVFDVHLLDVIINYVPTVTHSNFLNLAISDFEVRISQVRASTSAGSKTIKRCQQNGVGVQVCGATDQECDDIMLEQSDYLITTQFCSPCSIHTPWYWNHARPGFAEDNMLTNPKYDVSKHDVSLTRLRDRYAGRGWRASSGAYHGNNPWHCQCEKKCKRGRCKVPPAQEGPDHSYFRLPEKGSAAWRDLTANDICQKHRWQKVFDSQNLEEVLTRSIATFSGD